MASDGVTLGFLKYILGFDSLSFNEGATAAEKRLKMMQKSFAKQGQRIASIGKTLALGLTTPLIGLAAAGIKEAEETAKAMAQVNAALASMGPVAGRTAAQLKSASDALEMKSLYEGDQILKDVTANLLTFGNVSGQVFDRAQQAALDMSTRLGTDLQSSAIILGKALNDPIKGITALTRIGVQFTQSQKDQIAAMIASGQTAKAQGIILAEVERQFAGSAQAAANVDPLHKVTVAFKQMAETIGTALLPVLPVLTDALARVLQWFSSLSPATQKWLIIVGGGAAVLGPLLVGIGALVGSFGTILPLIMKLGPAWAALNTAFAFTRALVASALLPALLPLLPWLAAAAGAVALFYAAWNHWPQIVGFVQSLYTGVKTWLMDKLGAVFEWVKGKLAAVGDWFHVLYDRVVGHSYIPDMVDEIGQNMARLQQTMVEPAKRATKMTADVFKALSDSVGGLLAQLFPDQAAINDLGAKYKVLDDALAAKLISPEAYQRARDRLNAEMKALADQIENTHLRDLGLDQGSVAPDFDASQWQADMERWGAAAVAAIGPVNDKMHELGRSIGDDVLGGLKGLMRGFGSLKDIGLDVLYKIGDALIDKVLGPLTDALGGALGNVLGGVFGGSGSTSGGGGLLSSIFGGGRAIGGPVMAGHSYLVGERGPELLTMGSRGYVTPNNRMSGRGGVTVNQTFAPNFAGNAATREDMVRFGALVKADTIATMRDIQGRRA